MDGKDDKATQHNESKIGGFSWFNKVKQTNSNIENATPKESFIKKIHPWAATIAAIIAIVAFLKSCGAN